VIPHQETSTLGFWNFYRCQRNSVSTSTNVEHDPAMSAASRPIVEVFYLLCWLCIVRALGPKTVLHAQINAMQRGRRTCPPPPEFSPASSSRGSSSNSQKSHCQHIWPPHHGNRQPHGNSFTCFQRASARCTAAMLSFLKVRCPLTNSYRLHDTCPRLSSDRISF
jgi:hypothetical protein